MRRDLRVAGSKGSKGGGEGDGSGRGVTEVAEVATAPKKKTKVVSSVVVSAVP